MAEAILALADGAIYCGRAFGARGQRAGEVVFNTGMTGYQEVLTDPSYKGQIVVMTAPHIGNYGVNDDDVESWRPHVEGFVVREASRVVSNWRAGRDLHGYLAAAGIVAISGVDTRALTRRLRASGAMMGIISSVDLDAERLVRTAREAPGMEGRDLVREVGCREPYEWRMTHREWQVAEKPSAIHPALSVVAYDFGIKHNILRKLSERGCAVAVVPPTCSAGDVLAMGADGVFLSNGPGDPAALAYAVENVRGLLGRVPLFGICLGHQLLALALGGQTYKLKFGHHGNNQPVKNLLTGRVEITTHNHGFAVAPDSLPADVEATHVNLNDGCNEGLRHRALPAFSVQYHPEAAPGPHDADYLFDQFVELMSNA